MHRLRWSSTLFAAVCLLIRFSVPAYSAHYYKWIDDRGNLHIVDSLGSVPEKYRDQIDSTRYESENAPPEPARTMPQKTRGGTSSTDPGPDRQKRPGKDAKRAKKHEIPYTPNEGSAKRVIVQARINGSVTAKLAIDTGAPTTIISLPLAKRLGLFENDHGKLFVRAGGIGGTTPAIRSIIDTIGVGEAKSEFVPTTIIEEMSDAFEGLLGLDFVSNYLVTIDSARNVVVFEELPFNPEHPAGHDKDWWSGLYREFESYRSGWKAYSTKLDKKISDSMSSENNEDIARKKIADEQIREAEKLLDKLDRYASENSVPMHWRR